MRPNKAKTAVQLAAHAPVQTLFGRLRSNARYHVVAMVPHVWLSAYSVHRHMNLGGIPVKLSRIPEAVYHT